MKKKTLLKLGGGMFLILLLGAIPFTGSHAQEAAVPAREPFRIEIYSFMPGSGTYVMGVALADLINKHSKWLKATAVASRGATINTGVLAKEPAKRKNTLVWANFSDHFLASTGRLQGMAGIKYNTLRVVTLVGLIGNGAITLDPDIKNIRDFSGKRYALGPKAVWGMNTKFRALFQAAGIDGKMKYENMDFDKSKDALRDGLVDGMHGGSFYIGNGKWVGNPSLQELLMTKDVNFVQWNQSDAENAAKLLNVPAELVFPQYIVPAGKLGPKQRVPWTVNSSYMLWSADVEMPDDVVYEICRVVYENYQEFGRFHITGKAISRETMSKSESSDPKYVHPGALKLYREKELALGPIKLD
ncbi:MAG: TAXI family TRAP transporter solute-binding subunit [Desulfobacterales bacterium]|nr:TAXI family TRAP transporter solute-binding subunit [Desulfobacterales bacterium]